MPAFSSRLMDLGRSEINGVLTKLCDVVEASGSSLLLPIDRDHLAFFASTDPMLAGDQAPRVPIGKSFSGLAFQSGQTIALADAASQPGHFKAVDVLVAQVTREFAAVPMLDSKDTVVGILTLANRRPAPAPRAGMPFSSEDLAEAAKAARDLADATKLLARLDAHAPSSSDDDLAVDFSMLGERDRRCVRALISEFVSTRSSDHVED